MRAAVVLQFIMRNVAFVCIATMAVLCVSFSFSPYLYSQDIVAMVKRVKPAVVTVTSKNAFGLKDGEGSGFFIIQNQVVTNYHVIEGASGISIMLNDSSEFPAKHILAQDSALDIAILEIDIPAKRHVTVLPLKTVLPEQGEKIYVVGSPLGFEQSVSDGIVSSVRVIKEYGTGKLIQFTAAISHGNSGSPLLDVNGNVLGVARLTLHGGQNLNFAVPSDVVKSLKIGTPIPFAATTKMYDGVMMKISDAFKVDTSLLGEPPAQFSQYDKNIWRIKTAAIRKNWDTNIVNGMMNRIIRAVKRIYDNFDINKDTLRMGQASAVIHESLGENSDGENFSPENKQKLAYIRAEMALYAARLAIRGKATPVGGVASVLNGSGQGQVWHDFKKDGEYYLVTMADTSTITDLDIAVFYRDGNEWKAVACNTDNEPHSYVYFTAPESGEYAIIWRVAKFTGTAKEGIFSSVFLRE